MAAPNQPSIARLTSHAVTEQIRDCVVNVTTSRDASVLAALIDWPDAVFFFTAEDGIRDNSP